VGALAAGHQVRQTGPSAAVGIQWAWPLSGAAPLQQPMHHARHARGSQRGAAGLAARLPPAANQQTAVQREREQPYRNSTWIDGVPTAGRSGPNIGFMAVLHAFNMLQLYSRTCSVCAISSSLIYYM
jgi:hypothetical protein